jgi:hypothetical protein
MGGETACSEVSPERLKEVLRWIMARFGQREVVSDLQESIQALGR